jgi:hypothetical protein
MRFDVARRGEKTTIESNGKVLVALSPPEAIALGRTLLQEQGWKAQTELGLKVGDREPFPVDPGSVESHLRRLKGSGVSVRITQRERHTVTDAWREIEKVDPAAAARPAARRFTKEPAAPPPVVATTKPVDERKARAAERDQAAALAAKFAITQTLFADAMDQLRYEVTHQYLHTVAVSERDEFPMLPYVALPMFMADLDAQVAAVSRQQMLSAIVDIVTGRVWQTNSRQARAFRDGGGDETRPQITRADGSLAWRANISSGTPAARRVMWWVTPSGAVELARLTSHDDFKMPEK